MGQDVVDLPCDCHFVVDNFKLTPKSVLLSPLNFISEELRVHSVDYVEKELSVNGLTVDVLHVWEVDPDLLTVPDLSEDKLD